MSEKCKNINPLKRSGSNQKDRLLPALDPKNVKIDERTVSDFILFAKRYAKYIKFYDAQNKMAGNWLNFWQNDISVVIASLAEFPIVLYRQFLLDLRNYIVHIPEEQEAAINRHFKLLFYLPLFIVKTSSEQFFLLPRHHELRHKLNHLLEKEGKEPLQRIIAYYKGATQELASFNFDDGPLSPDDFQDHSNNIRLLDVVSELLKSMPSISQAGIQLPFLSNTWEDFYTNIPKDIRPYQEEALQYNKIFDALNYNLFVAALDKMMELMAKIANEARQYLVKTLKEYPEHSPHYGLWLAFLRLFQYTQTELNNFTKRHLEHYYEKSLQQEPLSPKADQVHLLIELSKNKPSHRIPANTLFKAGKDDTNRPVYYILKNDQVLNQARISLLKSLFLPENKFPVAAHQVNTLDGLEEAIPKEKPQWSPFFTGALQEDGTLTPKARIGFAIADDQLSLSEGKRSIFLSFDKVVPDTISTDFDIYYTSEKKWMPINSFSQDGNKKIKLEISADLPPVTSFVSDTHLDEELHTDQFTTDLPVIKFVLKSNFAKWDEFTPTSIQLSVAVEGLNNVQCENDFGSLDVSKPFYPFGQTPEKGNVFIVRHQELFVKSANISFIGDWELKNANLPEPVFAIALISSFIRGDRQRLQIDETQLQLAQTNPAITFHEVVPTTTPAASTTYTPLYTTESSKGFLQLELENEAYSFRKYVNKRTADLIKYAKDPDHNTLPEDAPPVIKLENLSLKYTTDPADVQHFYCLAPFGFKEQQKPGSLLPDFQNKGELYIGLEKAQPPQRINLLFQIVDGTANPAADLPNIQWSYLKDNTWVNGDSLRIDDKSDQITRSGIVGLVLPKEANQTHTILPSGYHWIRCSVKNNTDALNDLLAIEAQAILVDFVDTNNDPAFLERPLDPDTISKLKISDGAIKKIQQPYPSFGGRGKEQPNQYYARVSERLRHKNRAVQIWDYEHLILEYFPNIYKVKCLNHTELDNGLSPGDVTIVCIPKIQTFKKDPLRPYTEKKTLLDICRFLKKRISPFVNLKVVQPLLEEVKLDFSVAYTEDIADINFYEELLNQSIIDFLTPWANEEKGQEISFGGKWHKASIINFIEEQPYVKFIKDVKMFHHPNINEAFSGSEIDLEVIEVTTARSILVSHRDHKINKIDPENTAIKASMDECISEQYKPNSCQ